MAGKWREIDDGSGGIGYLLLWDSERKKCVIGIWDSTAYAWVEDDRGIKEIAATHWFDFAGFEALPTAPA
jgi:hypothetical protein